MMKKKRKKTFSGGSEIHKSRAVHAIYISIELINTQEVIMILTDTYLPWYTCRIQI